MALHSTGKQAHFPNYNISLYNRGRIGPKSLNLQYEAWNSENSSKSFTATQATPLVSSQICGHKQFIRSLKTFCLYDSFWGHVSAHYLLFGNALRNSFASGWLGLWNVGWDPSKWENNNNAAGFFLGVMLWKDTIIVSIEKLYTGIFFMDMWQKTRNQKSQRLYVS